MQHGRGEPASNVLAYFQKGGTTLANELHYVVRCAKHRGVLPAMAASPHNHVVRTQPSVEAMQEPVIQLDQMTTKISHC